MDFLNFSTCVETAKAALAFFLFVYCNLFKNKLCCVSCSDIFEIIYFVKKYSKQYLIKYIKDIKHIKKTLKS